MAATDSLQQPNAGRGGCNRVLVLATRHEPEVEIVNKLLKKRGLHAESSSSPQELMVLLATRTVQMVIAIEPGRISQWNELRQALERYYPRVIVSGLTTTPDGDLRLMRLPRDQPDASRAGPGSDEASPSGDKKKESAESFKDSAPPPAKGPNLTPDQINDEERENARLTADELAMLLDEDWCRPNQWEEREV